MEASEPVPEPAAAITDEKIRVGLEQIARIDVRLSVGDGLWQAVADIVIAKLVALDAESLERISVRLAELAQRKGA